MKSYNLALIALLSALAGVLQVFNGIIGFPTGFGMTIDLVGVPILLAFFLLGFEAALYTLLITAFLITMLSPTSWLGASMKFAATLPMFLVPAFYIMSIEKGGFQKLVANGFFALFIALTAFVFAGIVNQSFQPAVGEGMNQTLYSTPNVSVLGTEVIAEQTITLGSLLLGLLPIAALLIFSAALLLAWRKYGGKYKVEPLTSWKVLAAVILVAVFVRGVFSIVSNYYYAGPIFWHTTPEQLMAIAPWYLIFGWNAVLGVLEVSLAWVIAFKFKFAEKYGEWF